MSLSGMPDNQFTRHIEPFFKTEWIAPQESVLVIGVNRSLSLEEAEHFKTQIEARLPQGCRAMVLSDVSALTVISGIVEEDIPTESPAN